VFEIPGPVASESSDAAIIGTRRAVCKLGIRTAVEWKRYESGDWTEDRLMICETREAR
jgi:hypothetical protein